MYRGAVSPQERIGPALLAALVAGAIGWLLVAGLAVVRHAGPDAALATFDVMAPRSPPAPRVVPDRRASRRPEGRAAPAGLRAQATEIVAPPPVVRIPPPPVVVAPVAGIGRAASQGAADRPGPGPGAGGVGDGRGSGGAGDGDGGGDYETPPRWLRGELTYRDVGSVVGDDAIGRAVTVRCTVRVDTRLTGCTIIRSTGLLAMDRRIVERVEQRVRYSPWRDENGTPGESRVLIDYAWDEER